MNNSISYSIWPGFFRNCINIIMHSCCHRIITTSISLRHQKIWGVQKFNKKTQIEFEGQTIQRWKQTQLCTNNDWPNIAQKQTKIGQHYTQLKNEGEFLWKIQWYVMKRQRKTGLRQTSFILGNMWHRYFLVDSFNCTTRNTWFSSYS